jgi:hypothetical protein
MRVRHLQAGLSRRLPYAFCVDWALDYYVGGSSLRGSRLRGRRRRLPPPLVTMLPQGRLHEAERWARDGYIQGTYAWTNISTGGEWCTAATFFCYALSDSNATSRSQLAAAVAPYTWTS